MMLRLIGIGTVFALVAVSYALLLTQGALDTERLHHAATATERDHWKATAEAYRADAEAQAENTRRCLAREAQAQRDAAERDAIVRQAKPRARTTAEQVRVVDDETRRRAVARLNRPL